MANFATIMKTFGRFVSNNSPKILTGMAVAGVISTTVLAVKATPEAIEQIDQAKLRKHDASEDEAFTPMDMVKAAWACYIPAAAVGTVTIACVIGGSTISSKRNAALMSLYSITETGFREYQEKVISSIGSQKEQKIRDEVAKDRIERDPVTSREVIVIAGGGDVLCYDSISGRYFQSDVESIRRAVNDVNEKIINESYASQNDFYRLLGLPSTQYNDEIGWSTDNMLNVDFTTVMSDDNRPCISINYRSYPLRGYYNSFL